jgi:hypothetical protein
MITPKPQPPSNKREAYASWWAQQRAEQARAELEFEHVAAPADAKQHSHWEKDDKDNWTRTFEGTSRKVGRTDVRILGRQSANGSVTRFITIDSGAGVISIRSGAHLDAKTARKVAAAVAEAANEVDSLAANPR